MDTQDPPIRPRYQLTRGLIGLDNEKDAMTSRCLDRKEVRHATLRAHTGTGTLVGALCTHIRRLFLSFGGPVCADRISNCPLDRVLTYKNLIYLLNLQICLHFGKQLKLAKEFGTSLPENIYNPIFQYRSIRKAKNGLISIHILLFDTNTTAKTSNFFK